MILLGGSSGIPNNMEIRPNGLGAVLGKNFGEELWGFNAGMGDSFMNW